MVAGQLNNSAIIIQARISSDRLPCKIALDLSGKTVLERVINQCKYAESIADIIIATSSEPADDITEEIGARVGINVYRGSLLDVRSRYLDAGKGYDNIIRVTADNPFTEPSFIFHSINELELNNYDYVSISNCPYGSGVQGFKYKVLRYLKNLYDDKKNREHVLIEKLLFNDEKFKTCLLKGDLFGDSNIRLTIDTFEDYVNSCMIYKELEKECLDNNLENVIPIYHNYNNGKENNKKDTLISSDSMKTK